METDRTQTWDASQMLGLLRIFSNTFFLQPLPAAHCGVGLQWDHNLRENLHSLGKCSHTSHKGIDGGRFMVNLLMDPADWKEHTAMPNHQTHVLSTLLHEMVHAYLYSYGCDADHDSDGNCARDGERLWPKDQFHCMAWFQLSCAIEVAMKDKTGVEVNLACFRAYILDVEDDGGKPFSADDWKRFFANCDWVDVEKLYGRLNQGQAKSLGGILEQDPEVMEVWATKGEAVDKDRDL